MTIISLTCFAKSGRKKEHKPGKVKGGATINHEQDAFFFCMAVPSLAFFSGPTCHLACPMMADSCPNGDGRDDAFTIT